MSGMKERNMDKRSAGNALGFVIILGSVWGLSECALGAAVHACANRVSGSLMTGVALFFIAAAWSAAEKAWSVAALVAVASLYKMFDAVLLSRPLRDGAIANPIFAFFLEGAAFVAVAAVVAGTLGKRTAGRAAWGGAAALLAVGAFPAVKAATGIAACLAPGTNIPLAWYYAPLAIGLSLLTVPLGIRAGERAAGLRVSFRLLEPSLAVVLSLALMALVRQL
jgi:hypothetical protein